MLPGETILSGGPLQCPDCKVRLVPRVLRSAAGYYIGTQCSCGPYSRESDYFGTLAAAEAALPSYLEDSRSPESARTPGLKVDPRGTKCTACKQHMLVADGCTICLLVLKDGTRIEPRKYEGGWDPGTGRCADCGAKIGHYHHPAAT